MSVKALNKTMITNQELPISSQHEIDRFIGSAEHPQQVAIKSNDHRLTLRIPKVLMDRIDILRAQRPGIISRNQCILEILQKGAE